jgi:ribonuclease HII
MRKNSLISFKNPESNKLILCGIDEAGRGPVFGPMIICGVCFHENQIEFLKQIGVKDSKMLSSEKRTELFRVIKQNALNFKIIEVSVKEIDQRIQERITLNQIEQFYMAQIINDLIPDKIYIDAADVNEKRFTKSIEKLLKYNPNKLIAEHKADFKYPIVSASSIMAKVVRDFHIEQLKKKFGDFGSGYPSDEKTVEFLHEYICKHRKVPSFARKTWQTTKRIVNKELKNRKITEYTDY